MKSIVRAASGLALLVCCASIAAQQLDMRFSCSTSTEKDGEKAIYADSGEMRLVGDRIDAFRWESALHRSTHGFDCSIDESDGLVAEVRDEPQKVTWRIGLGDARAARDRRGFTFDRRMNCTIRLEREGDDVHFKPSCPALCGSRANFTELTVNTRTGECRYDE